MKTVIIYTTKHGCTENCATKLKDGLNGEIDLVNLKKISKINWENYNTIIIGGSIHAGKIQSKIKKFCQNHLKELLNKKLGLFLCCMEEGDTAEKQFNEAYPGELKDHATAIGIFGGEFNFERMNFIERAIIKKIAKVDHNVSKLSEENIKDFIQKMN
jgi:menaquinone-dependent protoporphyrinogen oxidase